MARLVVLLTRYAPLWPYLNWGLFILGAVIVLGALAGAIPYGQGTMGDGRNYWEGLAYSDQHYRYSPAFLWATAPLRALPFEWFTGIWAALHIAATAWLGPWLLAVPFVADDAISGNVNTFLAVALVLSLRQPGWWAFPLLTKVTPGVGVLYHAGRRDWRALAWAVVVTVGIVAVGAAIDVDLWLGWLESLRAGTENYPNIWAASLVPRVILGALLCLLAARWVWLLPVGMVIAMPGLWPSSFALLAAIPRLLRLSRSTKSPLRRSAPR